MRRRARVAWRLYAFGIAIVCLTLGTMITLPLAVSHRINARDARLVAMLVRQLAERYPTVDALETALATDPELARLDLQFHDTEGHLVLGIGTPQAAPSARERAVRPGAPLVDRERVVLAIGAWIVVHRPTEPEPPVAVILILLGVILVLTALATLWFARSFARPLDRLATTVRSFGGGDTTARARLPRGDELGEVGHAFDDMADRIDQLLQTQGTMMADISHELRTPLTRIRLALDLASADPHAARTVLDEVGADLEEIEQIIDEVFAVVRLSSDSAHVEREPLDLIALLHRSEARFRAFYPDRELRLELPPGEAVVRGDATLVRRALDNLLDNAVKYSAHEVVMRLVRDAGSWTIEVHDRGIGMTADELARAFTPFWRADGSRTRTTGGVGLGLALARRVARAHGGDVTLTSSPGRHTTARLVLEATEP